MRASNILIPIAAFAVTVTGVSAFNSDILDKAGLTEEQKSAFEEAKSLRENGNKDGARDVLVEAGIDATVMEKVRDAMHSYRDEHRDAIREAVEANDYEAFKIAIEGSPMADIINSQSAFDQLVEAHDLREGGDMDGAKAIMDELGMRGEMNHGQGDKGMKGKPAFLDELTESQKEAFEVAKEANDKETMKAILDEAGVERPDLGRGGHMRGVGMHDRSEEDGN